ncbi:exo-alpha-sialidase [Paenibacillus sp. GXUN7292]|uniref:exo-alpha-sialidase n=1 Tax=Paenibacillus sp. GXUN7292 TaxID=3422499 RepID=UPI003D7E36D4
MNINKIVSVALSLVVACSLLVFPAVPKANAASKLNEPKLIDVFDLMCDCGENHIHGSTIVELGNGELLVAWFQGSGEKDGDSTKIMGARLPQGESKWTEPFVMVDVPGFPDINPSLYMDKNERLWLFWYPILANRFETSQPKYVYAEKGNYEYASGFKEAPKWDWQEIMYVNPGDDFTGKSTWSNGSFTHGIKGSEMRYFSDASLISQVGEDNYVEVIGKPSGEKRYIIDSFAVKLRNAIKESTDSIQASRAYGDKTDDFVARMQTQELPQALDRATGAGNNLREWNPIYNVIGWQTKNKAMEIEYGGKTRLLLPLYSDSLRASIMAYSDDNGTTWNYSDPIAGAGNIQAATVQKKDGTLRSYFRNISPNGEMVFNESADGGVTWGVTQVEPNLKHNAGFDIVKLQTGEWVLPHTDSLDGRNSLSISISDDEGATWTTRPIQVTEDKEDKIHYPAVIQAKDGTIYVSYSQAINDGDMKNIRIAKFIDFVYEIEEVNVVTTQGYEPKLPAKVKVTFQEGTNEYPVVWEAIDPGQYKAAGTFKVKGTVNVDGKSLNAYAQITVRAAGVVYPPTEPPKTTDPEPETETPIEKKFTDLGKHEWSRDAIEALTAQGVILGTSETKFSPEKSITRADFLLLLVRAFEFKAEFHSNFEDVAKTDYYYEALGVARELGLAKGTDGARFNPKANITRQDIMVLVHRALLLAGEQIESGTYKDISHFSDVSMIAEYARESATALVKEGIIVGDGKALKPLKSATRAETAVIIYRLLKL